MSAGAHATDLPGSTSAPRRPLAVRIARRGARFVGRNLLGTITHVRTTEAVAALTFDDGPDPENTPALLEILARHGAKATFFMLGMHARRHPDLVARIARAGHAVANHTFDHPRLPSLSRRDRLAQINDCDVAIAPHGAKLFRPPRGLQSVASRLDALRLGHRVITWNVAVYDWDRHTPEWFADRMEAAVCPGSIVLLHDLLHDPDDKAAADRRPVFAGLDLFLTRTGSRLSFITVPDLLACGQPRRASWFVRTDSDWAHNAPG
jgi:peptidoglycan/xylan/chitin deacetylase (PgdA/CDA1 family)